MRATKILVPGAAAIVVIAAIVTISLVTSRHTEQARHEPKTLPPPATTHVPTAEPSPNEQVLNTSDSAPLPDSRSAKDLKVPPAPTPVKKVKEPLRDPEARVALSLVGIDPEAEAYWLEAIFDPALPPNEREDLMEDLNEDGLSDYKRPGPQDLPLILNRLAIIEEILPHADEFIVTHLGEAYKDLLNLADVTQGGGAPVR